MNTFRLKINSLGVLLTMATGIILFSCKDDFTDEAYDINWPVPVISTMTETGEIEDNITITGTDLDKVNKVLVGTAECAVVSADAISVVFALPRRVSTGEITLHTSYKRVVTTESKLEVTYPATEVTVWPDKIVRGQAFTIEGVNVDLITSVSLGTTTLKVDGFSLGDQNIISVPLEASLELTETVVLSVGAFGESTSQSTSIPVEDPSSAPTVPMYQDLHTMIWDFEDGLNPFQVDGEASTNGINAIAVNKGRGQNYLSVHVASTGGWTNFGKIQASAAVDLADYEDPHLTMLINTNGKKGYFQVEDGNGNWKHFTGTENENDDYAFATTGWEWRSVSLSDDWDGGAVDLTTFTPALFFKSGNVGNGGANEEFEIHVDQVMITNGRQDFVAVAFDFEDGVDPAWDNNTGADVHTINGGAVASISGENYYTVQKAGVGSWDWTGAIAYNTPVDLSGIDDPYITFWANTGSLKGFFQIETFQQSTKFGAGISGDNLIETSGEWVRYSLRLADVGFGSWGGTDEFDANGVYDYIKLGFTSGNIDGENYEINVDDVVISDGAYY
ncbi:MAG: IPT/TIG domain-containing protein [Reichenbachiella sp.]|uniref:IPT/TIG domain-containing protein n=1 Tax=Reichenbachiella sp. TaxID=2184521 RepID=UPI003266093D